MTTADRAFASIDFGLCWEWQGYCMPAGHGRFRVNGRKVLAHRWVWEYLVGPIADGLELDHLCRNASCCNPDHLEPVTHRVNVLRGNAPAGRHVRKTHCPRGHEYTPENTRLYRGSRYCRACKRRPHKLPGASPVAHRVPVASTAAGLPEISTPEIGTPA